ncbi:MAG TPA: DNA repair exonuclease [Roseiarcus sp.]|nr:DNA repair exonuclease [Roseiarcus sp.]
MRFQFIHAADLHIDSPLAALGAKDAGVAGRFAAAGRAAVERLIAEAIDSGAKFLIVAGDVFDGDWRDVSTGLFFARELGKLDRAGIATFLIKGNHDAENRMSRTLAYPPSVHAFDTRKGQTQVVEEFGVALHGRSFPDRAAPPDFLAGYAPRREGFLNIGVLHTSLDGAAEHAPYAPCTVADLARFGYDYWALGHIHAARVVSRDPWIVFPGNLQGRNPRETGAKGAVRVSVEDGRIADVEPIVLDAARWAHERVDVTGIADEEAALARIGAAIEAAVAAAEGRPLALRLTLTGATPAHARLVARLAEVGQAWRAEAQELAYRAAEDCWIEKIRLETTAPPTAAPDLDALDVAGLLAASAQEPEFLAEIEGLKASLAGKAPPGLLDELLRPSSAEWAARARDLLLGARA